MKKLCFIPMVLFAFLITGCSSSNIDGIAVGKVSNSECLNRSRSREAKDASDMKTMLRLTREGNNIVGELINYYITCLHYDIIVDCKQEGSELAITVSEDLPQGDENILSSNCLCPINIYFTIYDIAGDSFHVKVGQDDYGNASFIDTNMVELTVKENYDLALPSIAGDGWVTADETASDDIKLRFRLTKSDGTPANTFSIGENIVCDLQIINETNDTIFIGEDMGDVVIGNSNLFAVYRSDGSYVGAPYDNNCDRHSISILLLSNKDKKETRIRVPLFEKDNTIDSGLSSPYFLENWQALPTLSRGVYYLEFPISYNTTPGHMKFPLNSQTQEEMDMKEVVFKLIFKVK